MSSFRTASRSLLTSLFYRDLLDIVKLVIGRVRELPRHQLLMLWHHVYLETVPFLNFKRL
jgi:hypothetical protein